MSELVMHYIIAQNLPELTLVYLCQTKHCCTQTNGNGEDNAPPAPEDKNRLKVTIN